MLQELKSLSRELKWIGLKTKSSDIDLLIKAIAGDYNVDAEIEFAISELIQSSDKTKLAKIKNELTELLMLHGDYTNFLDTHSIANVGDAFYVKNANGSRETKLTASPEEAVALFLIKQSNS